MSDINENNLYIRVMKFWEEHPEWFTFRQLQSELNFTSNERKIIEEYISNALMSWRNLWWNMWTQPVYDSIFVLVDRNDNSTENALIILKYDAYFNYIDYLELQKAIENSREANEHAKWAKNLALWAIWFAIITGILQFNADDSTLWQFIYDTYKHLCK